MEGVKDRCEACENLEYKEPEKKNVYCCEYSARSTIQAYCDTNFVPLTVTRTEKENLEKNRYARIYYQCAHGRQRNAEGKERAKQFHHYTGCLAHISLKKLVSGKWTIVGQELRHLTKEGSIAHTLGGKVYGGYAVPKRREESSVVEDIVKLARVNAPTIEICSRHAI